MRKYLLFIILFININVWSKQIGQTEAKQIAENFVNNHVLKKQRGIGIKLVFTAQNEDSKNKKAEKEKYYYVYNIGENQGFIIISADDVNYPIIGYSKSGSYDSDNLPENFKSWMMSIELGMQDAFDNFMEATEKIQQEWEEYRSQKKIFKGSKLLEVQPLIQTKWSQDVPYNSQIPYAVYTGCVATAVAQIMKYHNYPQSGTGKIPAYQTKDHYTGEIYSIPEINLTQYTYDWNSMLNNYVNYPAPNYSEVQGKAVGLLMYHVGAGAKMKYGKNESGATGQDALKALYNYFDYDKSIDFVARGSYYFGIENVIIKSDEEWENIIIKELGDSRPVFYAGGSEETVHAFVCDGYDSEGLFHFNFGWGGIADGYYNANAPLSYKINQSIGFNIKPNEGGEKITHYYIYKFETSKNTVNKNECFTVNHIIFDLGVDDLVNEDNFYLALCNLEGDILSILGRGNSPNGGQNYYSINDNIQGGEYRLRMFEKKENNYIPVKGFYDLEEGIPITLLDEIKSHNLFLRNNTPLSANREQAGPKDYLEVKFSFGNSKCKKFTGNIALVFTNDNDEIKYVLKQYAINNLNTNAYYPLYPIWVNLPADIANGDYRIRIFARENENQSWQVMEGADINYLPITIINGTLSMDEVSKENHEFIIYPNPVVDILYIKSEGILKVKSVFIYDYSGKEVIKEIPDPSQEINVSNLSEGSYIIKIQTSQGFKIYKFIKK